MSQRSGGRRARQTNTSGEYRGAGVYPRELVPAARPGDHVRLEPDGDVYEVDVMVPQPTVRIFTGGVTVTTNGINSDNEATNLEMPTNWLGQYRPIHLGNDLDGDPRVTIDQSGQQAPLYTNKNFRGEFEDITATEIGNDTSGTVVSDSFNHHLEELYVWEDNTPYFTFEDINGNNPTISDIRYAGFQYRLVPAQNPQGHVEPVPTERVRE